MAGEVGGNPEECSVQKTECLKKEGEDNCWEVAERLVRPRIEN